MASTYSQYKIQLIGTGEEAGQWGDITNNNFGSATPGTYRGFEQAIGGRADVTMSSTTITLSLTDSNAAQDARALYLNLTGTPGGAADLVVPALQKSYLVKNGTTGGFAVTIKVTGQTGVSIPNGKTVWVYNNGTDVVTAVDHIPSLTLGAALPIASGGTGSTSTTFVNLATNVTGTLPVANGGTGITSFGTGVGTALGVNTGSAGAFVVNGGALGTPSSGTLTSATGLPIATGVSGLGTNVATFLGTPSSANLAAALTDETGTGLAVFGTTPTLTGLREAYSAVTSSSGTATLDFSAATVFQLTLSEDVSTFTWNNAPTSGTAFGFTLKVIQDSTARTIAFPASVDWPGGIAPTLSSGSGDVDVFTFFTIDGGTTYYGFTAGQDLS
jgi:hypothetical protein